VVRSLLAAERSSWVVGVVVGWVVVRLVMDWPVSWDVVVVAVDIGARDLHEGSGALDHRREQKRSLAGDGSEGLERAISQRGD
jgi:hypothetical protein